jgi:hypothetical protein
MVTRFAAVWRATTGALTAVSTEERFYRLDKLCPPTAVAGEPRSADDADTGVLVDWLNRFHAEQFGDAPDPAAARSVQAAKRLGDEFVLWTLEGDLVSMAAPLKFRPPGVTLQIGLGIGRLVFRALNTT